jgi:hypothetical protein
MSIALTPFKAMCGFRPISEIKSKRLYFLANTFFFASFVLSPFILNDWEILLFAHEYLAHYNKFFLSRKFEKIRRVKDHYRQTRYVLLMSLYTYIYIYIYIYILLMALHCLHSTRYLQLISKTVEMWWFISTYHPFHVCNFCVLLLIPI